MLRRVSLNVIYFYLTSLDYQNFKKDFLKKNNVRVCYMTRCEGKQRVCKHVYLSVETRGPEMLLTSFLERVSRLV